MTTRRHLTILACTLIGTMALAGCQNPAADTATDSAATQPASPTASPPGAGTPDAPSASATGDELDKYADDTNIADGAVDKKLGEAVTLKTPSGLDYETFTFTKFTSNFECNGPLYDGKKPKNGQFLAAEVSVTVGSEEAVKEYGLGGSASFSSLIFKAQDADGKDVASVRGNSFTCLDVKKGVPASLKPGQTAKGLVVFDLPEHGTLFAPNDRTLNGTWAWKF